MRTIQQATWWLGISIFAALTFSAASLGQSSADSDAGLPVVTDWSHHHVVFSKPATAELAERLKQDPRYMQQQARTSAAGHNAGMGPELRPAINNARPDGKRKLRGDWAQDMGSGATVGAANYPAKFSFRTDTANCGSAAQPDFVVYGTGLLGSVTQATIVAYDNLYSGCTGTVPSVYWAINTGGTAVTSPVLSRDGTQVAFVQTGGGYPSTLVLLKWAASIVETVTAPLTITRVPKNLYPACVAPCMTTLNLKISAAVFEKDSNSSLFYDYTNDAGYVGGDAGYLHRFTPVFKGIPVQILTGGWPVQVNPGAPTALTSPVYDLSSRNVLVADNGGFLYRVDPSAAVTQSAQLDVSATNDGGPGIVEGPQIDPSAGKVYVYVSADGSHACGGLADCAGVAQLSTSFLSTDTPSEAVVGASTHSPATPSPIYIGAFDSKYENSVDPPTGNLYVCGNTGGSPALYQIAISSGSFNTVLQGPTLSASPITPCSPVSDVVNPNVAGGTTEWIFASTRSAGIAAGCSGGGCIFNFKNTPWQRLTAYTVGQEIVDSHFQIQVVSQAGTSAGAAPGWSTLLGHVTNDGGVKWINQGLQSDAPPAWMPNFTYALDSKILDPNGNVQLVTVVGLSGGTIPTFSTTPSVVTTDNIVHWTEVGPVATAALPAAGGTSGIILDNTVSSGTQAGASQVYFSTLSDQVCGTSGTGGCAVQASQSDLH